MPPSTPRAWPTTSALKGGQRATAIYAHAAWLRASLSWTLVAPARVGTLSAPRFDDSVSELLGLADLGVPDIQVVEAFRDSRYPSVADLREQRPSRISAFEPRPVAPSGGSFEVGVSRAVLEGVVP